MASTSKTVSDDNEELGAFTERSVAFVGKVKDSISDGKVYKDLIGVLVMSQNGSIKDIKTLLDNVNAVFTHHKELYEEFQTTLFFHEEHEYQATVRGGQKVLKTYVSRKRKRREEEEKVKKFAQDLITSSCFSDKIRNSNETCTASYRKGNLVAKKGQEELLVEQLGSAIENLKLLEKAVNRNPSSKGETINIEEYLTPIDLKCIEKSVDDHERVEILKSLGSNPKSVLPYIYFRVKNKKIYYELVISLAPHFEN